MSLEKLNKELSALDADIKSATEKVEGATSGPSKVKASKALAALEARKVELLKAVEEVELKKDPEISEPTEEVEKPTKALSKEDFKTGDPVVVKNISRFMLHNDGHRYVPNIEIRAHMCDFIRGNIDANLFVIVSK